MGNSYMQYAEVTYEVQSTAAEIEATAEALLLEQTFETPLTVLERYPRLYERGRGRIGSIREVDENRFRVRLLLPDQHAHDASQLLNLIFGNAAIHPHSRLIGVEPTASMTRLLPGPTVGMQGIREKLMIPTRPLTATALKPVGLPLSEIVALCRDFAASGIDVIKDDHYLSDHPDCPFEERVRQCSMVVRDAGQKHGRPIWYVPSISGTPSSVRRQIDFALEAGVACVMLAPMALGLPLLAEIAAEYPELTILSHPSFSPLASFALEVLWGTLFRMYGADAIIFVSAGGRFDYSLETCRLITANMRASLHGIRPSLAVPAGGISIGKVKDVVRAYGNDSMLLIGGSILKARNRREAAMRFVESVDEHTLLTSEVVT